MALQPRSRGRLRLHSAEPLDRPILDPGYLSELGDLRVLEAGLELARRIVAMPAFAGLRGAELAPADASLEEHLGTHGQGLYHPVGTCRMGTDERAVVDHELRVHGLAGLRVVDASVMPRLPRGHTNLPAMMIAERVSELIVRSASRAGHVAAARGDHLVLTLAPPARNPSGLPPRWQLRARRVTLDSPPYEERRVRCDT